MGDSFCYSTVWGPPVLTSIRPSLPLSVNSGTYVWGDIHSPVLLIYCGRTAAIRQIRPDRQRTMTAARH